MRLLLALPLVVLTACSSIRTQPYVTIASEPSGARILVNERDSGFVTPAVMHLDEDDDHRIDLMLPGYVQATRFLGEWTQSELLLWDEMMTGIGHWRFLIWVRYQDFLRPLKRDTISAPNRIFVRLRRSADRS